MTTWQLLTIVGALVVLAGAISLITSIVKELGIDLSVGWRLRCTKCGRSKSGAEIGMIRLAAWGKKYTLGFCSACDRMRWIVIERVPVEESAA